MTANSPSGNRYAIRAVDRVCDILDLVRARSEVSLPDVATATGMPKSSAFRYLATLEERQYIERDEASQVYRLGLAFQNSDDIVVERLKRLAEGPLARLRDASQMTVNLGLLDGSYVVHALVFESPLQMRVAARVGEVGLIHSTALGKVLAASKSEQAVRSMLARHGMPRYTAATVTDADDYLSALVQVRTAGFGLDDSENQIGGRCIAVALAGAPLDAAISMSAPEAQLPMSDVPRWVEAMTQIARTVESELDSAA